MISLHAFQGAALAVDEPTLGAHCFDCKERFRIPTVTKVRVRCPVCGSGRVIDHNLEPLAPVTLSLPKP